MCIYAQNLVGSQGASEIVIFIDAHTRKGSQAPNPYAESRTGIWNTIWVFSTILGEKVLLTCVKTIFGACLMHSS